MNQYDKISKFLSYVLRHQPASIRLISDICEPGLIAGSRHYVHLSTDENTALTTGARHGEPVVLTIAAGEMHKTGYPFYLTDNGVWLTPHVPVKYLLQKKPG